MSILANRPVVRLMGNLSTALFAVVIVLQLLLAAGILPITMAWGGTQSELTLGLRLSSLGAVVILAGFAYVIRRRAGLLGQGPPSTLIKILAWLVTAFLALNTLGNLTSSSLAEKLVFGTITVLLVVACAVVSLSRPS
jgi:hypothetical protein